jgi:hypothetical protein
VAIKGVDAVVNAAGFANPTSHDLEGLKSANAVLPGVVVDACALGDVGRLVHISSASVQGDLSTLDESAVYRAQSPYAVTKMLGEQALLAATRTRPTVRTVILRPTSVHGAGRSVTCRLIQLARSPFASVIAPGQFPTPQVLVQNVGAAVEYLCRGDLTPPPIVLQPWEGWTTGDFLKLLSGQWPHKIPARSGRSLLRLAALVCPSGSRLAYRRRLEILWCGQAQVTGWLNDVGFTPPYGREDWERLVQEVAGDAR